MERIIYRVIYLAFGAIAVASMLHAVNIQFGFTEVKNTAKADVLNRYLRNIEVLNITDMFPPGKQRNCEVQEIILHHDELSKNFTPIAEIKGHQTRQHGGISYHYYITKQGKVYKLRPETEALPHTTGRNNKSIGICLHGNFDHQTPTAEQLSSLVKLIEDISYEYGQLPVKTHRHYNPFKTCPGANFPTNTVRNSIYKQHFLLKLYENLILNFCLFTSCNNNR